MELLENRCSWENRKPPEHRQRSGLFWASPFTMHLVGKEKGHPAKQQRQNWLKSNRKGSKDQGSFKRKMASWHKPNLQYRSRLCNRARILWSLTAEGGPPILTCLRELRHGHLKSLAYCLSKRQCTESCYSLATPRGQNQYMQDNFLGNLSGAV